MLMGERVYFTSWNPQNADTFSDSDIMFPFMNWLVICDTLKNLPVLLFISFLITYQSTSFLIFANYVCFV